MRPKASEIFTHIVINSVEQPGTADKNAVINTLTRRVGYSEREVIEAIELLTRAGFIYSAADKLTIRK